MGLRILKLCRFIQRLAPSWNFREYLIKMYNLTGVKFVSTGCSFSGSVAAWARVQHPDLFLGAVASCPVLDVKYEFVGCSSSFPAGRRELETDFGLRGKYLEDVTGYYFFADSECETSRASSTSDYHN
ncbi:Thymus-specific serine protease [Perkinsus chesapeaki]|uniref:Thymus-specific serine protease n=1 Tax=Perkinsus chesapeaki TaxID=330153 RepID=A0A7J6LEK3_PERCH|nr:Thymus-specific serine protease [Perkinsus chesapeaki]